MHQGPRTRYDRELFAQGVGNMVCGLFGALPLTGVIVRSSANVQAGGRTRLSAILHGFWLLIFVAGLAFLLRLSSDGESGGDSGLYRIQAGQSEFHSRTPKVRLGRSRNLCRHGQHNRCFRSAYWRAGWNRTCGGQASVHVFTSCHKTRIWPRHEQGYSLTAGSRHIRAASAVGERVGKSSCSSRTARRSSSPGLCRPRLSRLADELGEAARIHSGKLVIDWESLHARFSPEDGGKKLGRLRHFRR